MVTVVPAALKSADITRFAIRAAQVEKAKPPIAYWCNYWIVNQILAKGLHTSDDESTTYTMGLMDKLEQMKAEHSQDDAIVDDVAGQAYVEQFGLETFQRGQNAMSSNKVTKQTADTFHAAATFLELDHIWGPLDPEIAAKIKYAKFHALRIAKAFKVGEDPNLSNPAPESPSNEQQSLDPNDPDVQALNGQDSITNAPTNLQPFVEEVPDEHHRLQSRMARASSLDQSLHPSRAASIPRPSGQDFPLPNEAPSPQISNPGNFYQGGPHEEVSPLAPSTTDRGTSEGGGYFPTVPHEYADSNHPVLPGAPFTEPNNAHEYHNLNSPSLPPQSPIDSEPHPTSFSREFPNHPGQVSQQTQPSSSQYNSYTPQTPIHPADPQPPTNFRSHAPHQHPQGPPPVQRPQRQPISQYTSQPFAQQAYSTDEEAIMKAQKHARWAISALNFEDVNTAVKELRGALEALGAA
ncbi:hypothetical protein MMC34_001250 [Xylographa carneopallida]|nr:hypothetical protein [Xylographa carneopallida]